MKSSVYKSSLLKAGLAALAVVSAGAAMAQSSVTLVAGPSTTALPDGRSVHMWGYTCGDATVTPAPLTAPAPSSNASCTALNGSAQSGTSWQPPLITVPKGSALKITLLDNLSFATGGVTNNVPTSIIIDGQLGGGLGSDRTTSASPVHAPQGTTWPGTLGGIDTSANAISFTPGSGYSSAPTVSFSGGGGGGAQAVATLAPAPVSALTVTARGSGYTSVPSVSFTGTGSGASATAYLGVSAVQVTSSGQGSYTSATPTVTASFSLPPCTINTTTCVQATGTVTMTTSGFGGGGTNGRRRVASVSVINPGAGYTSVPTVTFSRGNATAVVSSLGVSYATLGNGGTGYVGAPAVTIGGGGGSGASASAAVSASLGSITLTSAGSGYTSVPNINLVGGGCSGDCATATVTNLDDFLSVGTPTFTPPAQADRVRSLATEVTVADAAGKDLTWGNLRPGTYLIHSGTQPSIQHPMGLYGVLVVTDNDNATSPPTPRAYGATFDKDVALLLSEIDPEQNEAVNTAVTTDGFTDTAAWNGQSGQCGDSTVHSCYPPAVNYTPLYYLINGVAFDRSASASNGANVAAIGATATTGNVLVRLVNAGLHSHVPNIVGMPMTLLAEDGNKLPGGARVQNSVLLTAGKTYDTMIRPSASAGSYAAATLAVFDRSLGLSTNNQRDGGMQAYINVAGGATSGAGSSASNVTLSAADQIYYCSAGTSLSITDPSLGLLKGAVGASGVVLGTNSLDAGSTLVLNANGTFSYTPAAGSSSCGGTFTFLVNGTTLSKTATITQCTSAMTQCWAAAPTAINVNFVSNVATAYASTPPGVMSGVTNAGGLALKASGPGVNADGSFVVAGPGTTGACSTWNTSLGALPTGAACSQVPFTVTNVQGSAVSATATVAFLPASNLTVNLVDARTGVAISDYRWIIEEDKTFWIDPKCQINTSDTRTDSQGKACAPLPVESLGYSFHTAHMPVVAQGCVGTASCEQGQMVTDTTPGSPTFGQHVSGVCDVGNGICRADTGGQKTPVDPGSVYLDPSKRYFISILPGDGVNPTIGGPGSMQVDPNCDPSATTCAMRPFDIAKDCGRYTGPTGAWEPAGANAMCGHEMGGAQIATGQTAVKIALQQTPLPTAKISVIVFQDDNPLNGEQDAGGGVDIIAPNEAGLGGFEIKLFDQAGQLGDNTGQITYDEFNQPVSNALAGTIDPITKLNACPITARPDGLLGMIPTCPTFESDGKTPSPLAGQAVIANLYPGLYEIQAFPAADRIARGEEWLQTNTLDGGKPHEAFIKPNEPGYFQEFGPGGYHVAIGYANPAIINARKDGPNGYCASSLNNAQPCNKTLTVHITNSHMSRTPDQRTYSSETYDHYSFTNCYVSIGPADGQDFAFAKCSPDGTAVFNNIPNGTYKISVFDQWNDIMLDGLVGTVSVNGNTEQTFPVTQWRTNLFTRTFIDQEGSGVSTDNKPGLALVNTNIRYRDGSYGFFNNTDLNGYAGFNEVFPFMNWLVVETSATRFKPTGVHIVYDAGGPVDCSQQATANGMPCSTIAANLANTDVRVPLPNDLRLPGAVYCATADCDTENLLTLPGGGGTGASTAMISPPQAFGTTVGWQSMLGQNTFMEFGVKPFNAGENGGIHGMVIYASTRPFDDPSLSLQLSWEPGVPHVRINLYSETVDASGNQKLTLVDHTDTAGWDDWAQGFRKGADGTTLLTAGTDANAGYVPNMNCPGQADDSPFFATLKNSKMWLDTPDSAGNKKSLAYQSQFKCYDGWSQLNQAQPAPYDGYYRFPSVATMGADGKPASTNCTGCVLNGKAAPGDWDYMKPMLPAGKYVVEVVVPPGYELVKEEDKNILLGDVFIAPVTQQFAGFGNVFIMPDQATINGRFNQNNPGALNLTNNLGSVTFARHEGDTGSVEAFWACVGAERIVPDLNSLFPQAGQASPFAGATRRLCDRKEVTLEDQGSALTKFYVFSSTHIAGHFTGTITNDFASEFDPFSPQFGEKFGPPNLPVGLRDFNGNEVARVYSDQWGIYNGLYFSTWSVNPPNPTGYAPQMSIACMNDPGPILDTRTGSATFGQPITDPSYNPAYSNFCYEQPFMPGETTYMDTPVIPTQAFADGYNLPDTEYPDGTPVIMKVVNSSGSEPQGPWTRVVPGTSATVTFTISGVNNCTSSNCASRTTITFAHGTVSCDNNNNPGPNCNSNSSSTRAGNVASYIRSNIASLMGAGYTASGTGASVTVIAPAGASYNGATVISSTANLGGPTAPVALGSNGADPGGALGITISALGDKVVQNPNFSGPNSTSIPYNQKTITRHYGFGARPGNCAATGPCLAVTVGGVPLNDVAWTQGSGTTPDTITGTVNPTGVPACTVQQRGAATAQCGELVITAANGKQSIDAITVTIGGSAPWVVTETAVTPPSGSSVLDYTANFGRMGFSPIQTAIDSASPGDLILVQPGTYRENLIMWKPVRLQGVGAASVAINADAHPAGKMDQWRRQVNCVFGLNLDGTPSISSNGGATNGAYDPSGTYSCPSTMFMRVDRIPFEAIVGWDASGNGNLAQVLQEPTLMGAYEGAGITVLGRGVRIPSTSNDFWGQNATGGAGAFTDGSVYLTNSNTDCTSSNTSGRDYGTSNYFCNPARIDGVSVLNSSQGGGGVFVHGWAHNLDLANTHISANQGTLAGAINLGNGETPDAFINDGVECGTGLTGANAVTPCPPFPWNGYGSTNNTVIPFQFNTNVRIHHNMLNNNASIGDALFSGTPAGAGAITVSAGADGYRIDHNWIAGNLSTGDGGGVQHLGLVFNGQIDHNFVLYNQSTNPTLPTNGGGVVIEGANLDRQLNGNECGSTNDQDCPPGLGEGTGQGLVIDSNLILGNSAESGSGGGLRLQQINGSTDVITFPTCPDPSGGGNNQCPGWYAVTVTNNIIANNVAGYDGGGLALQDALKVSFVNNTVASNDSTASAGVLFKTLGAIYSATPPPGCTPTTDPTQPQSPTCTVDNAAHGPQPAGLVVMAHTPNLVAQLPGGNNGVSCPSGFGYTPNNGNPASNRNDCRKLSKPKMQNNLFWQNRAFSVNIVGSGTENKSQQNLIALTPVLNQTATGGCASGADFRDIGLRTDDLASGVLSTSSNKLAVSNSVYTSDFQNVITPSNNTVGGTTPVVAQFCNGARVPPENCAAQAGQVTSASCRGYNAPAGASETTGLTQVFRFSGIQPTATVDEGHNWLNLVYGPLTLSRPNAMGTATNAEMMLASGLYGTVEGAYSIFAGSSAANRGTTSGAPTQDFYGNSRSGHNDAGAVQLTAASFASVRPSIVEFGNVRLNATADQTLTVTAGSSGILAINLSGIPAMGFSRPAGAAGGTCVATLAANASCTIVVRFAPTTADAATGVLTIAGVVGSPVVLHGTGVKIDLTVTASSTLLQFGDAFVGTTTTPAQTVTLTNTSPGMVTGIAIGGLSASGPFVRSGGNCPLTATFSLDNTGPNSSCTIGVVFKPIALNPTLGAVTVTADAGFSVDGSPLQLTGNGLLPAVTPAALDFGDVVVGSAVTQTLTLNNGNNASSNSLAFTNIAIAVSTGSGFTRQGGTCGSTLAAGATCTIIVQFLPSALITTTGTVTITGSAGGVTVLPTVQLNGTGVAATHTATVSPSPLGFGNQLVGTTSATQNLTVTNTGNSALSGLAYAFGGGSPQPFSRVSTGTFPAGAPNCGSTLAVGAACTVKVQFAPTTATAFSRTLTITGSNSATITGSPVTLTGTGTVAQVAFTSATGAATLNGSHTTLAFGNDSGPVSSTVTLTVGAAPVTFGAASVSTSDTNTGFSKGADNCSGTTVAGGGTCTITINFNAPTNNRGRTGTLTVIDSTGALIVIPLSLTGS